VFYQWNTRFSLGSFRILMRPMPLCPWGPEPTGSCRLPAQVTAPSLSGFKALGQSWQVVLAGRIALGARHSCGTAVAGVRSREHYLTDFFETDLAAFLAFFRRTSLISCAIFLTEPTRRPSAAEILRALLPFRTNPANWRFSDSDQSSDFTTLTLSYPLQSALFERR
jgi:hypothetical protein